MLLFYHSNKKETNPPNKKQFEGGRVHFGSWFVKTQSVARKAWHLEGLMAVAVKFYSHHEPEGPLLGDPLPP